MIQWFLIRFSISLAILAAGILVHLIFFKDLKGYLAVTQDWDLIGHLVIGYLPVLFVCLASIHFIFVLAFGVVSLVRYYTSCFESFREFKYTWIDFFDNDSYIIVITITSLFIFFLILVFLVHTGGNINGLLA